MLPSRCPLSLDKNKMHAVALTGAFVVIVVWLGALNVKGLEVYLSLFAASYFITYLLFRPRRRFFDVAGTGLLVTFCYIVASKVMDILT